MRSWIYKLWLSKSINESLIYNYIKMNAIFSILFFCFISWLWLLYRFGKYRPGKLWKIISTLWLTILLFLMFCGTIAIFNQKLPVLMWIFGMLFYVIIWLIWYWIAGVFLKKKQWFINDNMKQCSNNKDKEKKTKNITCWKRFWKYILYLLRDWIIFLVLDSITQWFWIWRYDTFADSHFAFDMFVCFIIFIIETARLISDCSKIKKWTY
jgi:hypothetical protein